MILMNNFAAVPEEIRKEELAATQRVISSGWYILGKEVESFEREWAKTCGVKHAVGVGNGMDAIEIGLRAEGIGQGDEVITTPMTAFATVLAIIRAGATPVFADIDSETGLLDRESVARCISKKTKAVILVHLYGQVREMKSWVNFCRDHQIHLLEDCAQAHLSEDEGRVAGTFGAWGAYSFYPTKNLGTVGDAGALISNSDDVAKLSQQLRNYGQSERYHHPHLGLNSRLDEIQAALLAVRLKWLKEFTVRRQKIGEMYFAKIRNPHLTLLSKPIRPENHVFHLFVIRFGARDRLSTFLKERKIESLSHYPIPVHQQKPCVGFPKDPKGLAKAEQHAKTCLSIPCHPQLSDSDVNQVINALNEFQ